MGSTASPFKRTCIMQVRARRAAGAAGAGNGLAGSDLVAGIHQDRREMRVAGGDPIAMVDFDHVAVTAILAGGDHRAGCGRNDPRSRRCPEIDAGMQRPAVPERGRAGFRRWR